jgi:branched-chain amino acid transport system permease protein
LLSQKVYLEKEECAVRKRLAVLLIIAAALYFLSNQVEDYRLFQGANLAIYVIALSSLVLLSGYSGQVSLGQGAFMAVGGYSAALTLTNLETPLWFSFLVSILAASFFGFVFGMAAARLSGPFLAGSTLAFAVGLPALANQFDFLGGEQGIFFLIGDPPSWAGSKTSQDKWYFWIAASLAIVCYFLVANVLKSRFGRTWQALRGNPLAAELAGVNVPQWKVGAFIASSGLAGLAGALLAMTLSLVSPGSYSLALSFALITGAVLAGISSLPGVMLGAVILVAVPEVADVVAHRLGDSEKVTTHLPGLIVSVLLILSVIFTPNGPGENLRKHREKKHT